MSLELSIVLPAYKEAEALSKLLPTLQSRVAELTGSFEILVVDAQQPLDETAAVCRVSGVRHLFRRYGNLYGDAVRTGIEEAAGRYIVFIDADGSHNRLALRGWGAHRKSRHPDLHELGGERDFPAGVPAPLQGRKQQLPPLPR